jgi:hypothetical protein
MEDELTRSRKAHAVATVASAVALALPLFASPAAAATYSEEIEFASEHECTGEPVAGDTRVRYTITTTENPDGTTTVHTKQHTVGSQLRGLISNDKYTFNDAQDVETTETIVGNAGTVRTKTIFVHSSEHVAYLEQPGADDLHQRLDIVLTPLLPPTIVLDDTECK